MHLSCITVSSALENTARDFAWMFAKPEAPPVADPRTMPEALLAPALDVVPALRFIPRKLEAPLKIAATTAFVLTPQLLSSVESTPAWSRTRFAVAFWYSSNVLDT